MSSEFSGKVAFVTGGSGGVGRAVVRELAGRGADVAFTWRRNATPADALAAEVTALGRRALALACDITDADATAAAIGRTVAELGRLDVLAHTAGAGVAWAPGREQSPDAFPVFVAVVPAGSTPSRLLAPGDC